MTREQVELSHDLLLLTMKSIRATLSNEEIVKDESRTYKTYEAEFLHGVYWEMSQSEIHMGRLMKRLADDK